MKDKKHGVKQVLNILSNETEDIRIIEASIDKKNENLEKPQKDSSSEPKLDTIAAVEKIKLIDKREPRLINAYERIVSELKYSLTQDEEEALTKASLTAANELILTLSKKTADIIIKDILKAAVVETGNPLVEEETNKNRAIMLKDISGALSPNAIADKYPFIKPFDYSGFTTSSLPLEEENLLEYYYSKCSTFLANDINANALKEFSNDMLSGEFEVYLEDIARF